MAVLDALGEFTLPTISSTARAASATDNIYKASAARIVYGGGGSMVIHCTITSDDNTTIMVDFVGSDAADLDPNFNESIVKTIKLASTGVVNIEDDQVGILATSNTIYRKTPFGPQTQPRQYYGAHVVMGGTNPVMGAGAGLMKILGPAGGMTNRHLLTV